MYQLDYADLLTDDVLDESALRAVFVGARLVAAKEKPPENTIAATIPDDRALRPEMFAPLHGNLLTLIRSAETHLVLMSPFLSEQAYTRLRPALHTATANGADITLITRSLTYGDKDFNRDCARAMLNDDHLAPHLTLYEYVNDETWMTFHAKIVIADSEQAYLGTANLTHRGLGDNLELGVIFRDSTTERLSQLIESLMESQFFHRVARESGRFVRE